MELFRRVRAEVDFGEEAGIEKLAARYKLSDSPENYPSELLSFLYREHPYLGNYQVNLDIQQQDDSRGYLYGTFTISPRSDAPAPLGQKRLGEMSSAPAPLPKQKDSLRIPVIVENKKAYGFDVFITGGGGFLPLSERRVSAALFDTNMFAQADTKAVAAGAPEQAQSFSSSVPGEAGGGRTATGGSFAKRSSANSVLLKIELAEDDVSKMLTKVASDRSLRTAARENPHMAQAIKIAVDKASDKKLVEDGIPSPVALTSDFAGGVAVEKIPGGFNVATAPSASDNQAMQTYLLKNAEAGSIPVGVREEAGKGFPVLVGGAATPLEGLPGGAVPSEVTETGSYAVMDKDGVAQRAAVLTELRSIVGDKDLDSVLVIGPSGGAYQDKVAGLRCGDVDLSSLSGSVPNGWGFFLDNDNVATEPVFVRTSVTRDSGEDSYVLDHPWHGELTLTKTASAQKFVRADRGNVLIPSSTRFIAFRDNEKYQSTPVLMDKIASRIDRANIVSLEEVGSNPQLFSFSGEAAGSVPVSDAAHATAVLGVLGDSAAGAKDKLARAIRGEKVQFVARAAFPKASQEKVAAAAPDPMAAEVATDIRLHLVKEAAVLPSSETVDAVLSLGFITPENINGYVEAVPELETSASKLAELLIGVRLGLTDVPEAAVSSALRGIDRAITGLNKLQLRQGAAASQ